MKELGNTEYLYEQKNLTGYEFVAHRKRMQELGDDAEVQDYAQALFEDLLVTLCAPDGQVVEPMNCSFNDVVMPLASALRDGVYSPKEQSSGAPTEKNEG